MVRNLTRERKLYLRFAAAPNFSRSIMWVCFAVSSGCDHPMLFGLFRDSTTPTYEFYSAEVTDPTLA